MGFKFPYGNGQQLNLNWFIKKFKELLVDWEREKDSIDGALDAEIQRAEDALSDVYTARDTTIAAKNDALQAKADALTAAANAAQYWQNAAASANSAATSAVTALQAAQDAANDADQTSRDRALVSADKATVAADKAAVAADKAAVAADKAAVQQDKDDVDTLKDAANAAALRSEGWAVGMQNGTPVTSGSPYYQNNSKYFKEEAEAVLDSIPADYTELSNDVDELKDDVAELQQQSGGIVKTIEDVAIASFNDGLTAPVQELIVNIEPIQAGNNDPSPTNIRPITGFTKLFIHRTGKNLLGGDAWLETGSGSVDLVNRTVSGSSAGTLPNLNERKIRPKYKPNTQYTIILDWETTASNNRPGFSFNYTDGFSEYLYAVAPANTRTTSVCVSRPDRTLAYIGRGSYSGTKKFYVDGCGLFEGVITASEFEQYQGNNIEISWETEAGTVYGGTLDITKGLLTVDRIFYEYDGSNDENWLKVDNVNGYYFANAFSAQVDKTKKPITSIWPWNITAYSTMGELTSGFIAFSPTGQQLNIKDNDITSLDDFKTLLAEHPLQIPMYLSNNAKITYQLTPEQITTLLSNNNIWGDTGNIKLLRYIANTQIYIDNKDALIKAIIAKELATMTADTALTENDFRIVNDTLYRITANIAAGATLTPNTNCIATTVADVLKTLL